MDIRHISHAAEELDHKPFRRLERRHGRHRRLNGRRKDDPQSSFLAWLGEKAGGVTSVQVGWVVGIGLIILLFWLLSLIGRG